MEKRARHWCFTLNNPTESEIKKIEHYFLGADKFVFQEEEGEEKTKHIQGFVSFKNARAFSTLKKLVDRVHWEKAKNILASILYCMKDKTACGRFWSKNVELPPLKGRKLYLWQEELFANLSKDNDREITWYVDPEGNKGKTTLCKHLCMTRKDCIYVNGRAKDMKFFVAKMLEKGIQPRIILIDMTRSIENFVSYEGIEAIKNGIFFSGKYEATMCIYESPKVIVFANFEPDIEAMSKDRWNIIHI